MVRKAVEEYKNPFKSDTNECVCKNIPFFDKDLIRKWFCLPNFLFQAFYRLQKLLQTRFQDRERAPDNKEPNSE